MTETRASNGLEAATLGATYTLDALANGAGAVVSATAAPAPFTKSVKELGSGSYQYTEANFSVGKSACRLRYAMAQDTTITSGPPDVEFHSDLTSFGATNLALKVVRLSTGALRVIDNAAATIHTFTNILPTNSTFVWVELLVVCGTAGTGLVSGRIYTLSATGVITILDSFPATACTTTATIQSAHIGKITTGAYTPSTGITYHAGIAMDDGSTGFIGPPITLDLLGLTDAIALTRTLVKADAVGLVDAASRSITVARTVADVVGLTDARALTRTRPVADVVGLADAASRATSETRSAANPVGLTDAVSVVRVLHATAADSVGVTDAATIVRSFHAAPADNVGITDIGAPQALLIVNSIDADAIGITDAASKTRTSARTVADAEGLLDAARFTRTKPVADPAGIIDAVVVRRTTAQANPVGLTDTAAPVQANKRAPADNVGLTDAVVRNASIRRTVTDPVGITDAVNGTISTSRKPADPVGLVDTVAASIARTAHIADLVGLDDDVSTTIGSLSNRNISDQTGITDAITVTRGGARTQADVVGLTDAEHLARTIGVTASVGFQDFVTVTISSVRVINDAIGASDTTAGAQSRVRSISDSLGITDQAHGHAVHHVLRVRTGRPRTRWSAGPPRRS